jgi:ribosomal protein S18 acetylase RimI-like enzyme
MGRSSKFSFKGSNGKTQSGIGKFIGPSDIPDHGRFLVVGDPNLKNGVYHIKYNNFENIEAVIDVDYLRSQGLLADDQDAPAALIGDEVPTLRDIRRDKITKEDQEIADSEVPELPDLKKAAKEGKSKSIKVRDLKPGIIVLDGETKRLALVTDVNFDGNDAKIFLRFQDGERRVADGILDRAVVGWAPKGEPPVSSNDPTEVQQSGDLRVEEFKAGDKVFNESTNEYAVVVSVTEKAVEGGSVFEVVLKMADGSEQTISYPKGTKIKVWRTPYLGESGKLGEDLKKSSITTKDGDKMKPNLIQYLKNFAQNVLPVRPISAEPRDPELPRVVELSDAALENLKKFKYMGGTQGDMLPRNEDGTLDEKAMIEAIRLNLGPTATPENIASSLEAFKKMEKEDTKQYKVLRVGENFFLRYRSGDMQVDTLNHYLSQVQLLAKHLPLNGTPVFVSLLRAGDVAPGGKIMRPGIAGEEGSLVSRLLGVTIYEENTAQGIHIALNTSAYEKDRSPKVMVTPYHEAGHVAHHILLAYKLNPNTPESIEFRNLFRPEIETYYNKIKGNGKSPETNRATAEKEVFADLFADVFQAYAVDNVLPSNERLLAFAEFYNRVAANKESRDMGSAGLSDLMNDGSEIFSTYKTPITSDQSLIQAEVAASLSPDEYPNNYGAFNIHQIPYQWNSRVEVTSIPDHTELFPDMLAGETDSAKIEEMLRADFDARFEGREDKSLPHYEQGPFSFRTVASLNWPQSTQGITSLGGRVSINAKKDSLTGEIVFTTHAQGVSAQIDLEKPIYYFTDFDAAFKQASESLAEINTKWGKTDFVTLYKDPDIANKTRQVNALASSRGEDVSGSDGVTTTTATSTSRESKGGAAQGTEPVVAPQPLKGGTPTKDGAYYRFNGDGSVTGGAGSSGFLYIARVDITGKGVVDAIPVHGKDSSPNLYISSDEEGNLTLTSVGDATGEISETLIGNIKELYNSKNSARSAAEAMAKDIQTAASRGRGTGKPTVKALGTQNTRSKEIVKLISPETKFRVDGGNQTLAVYNFNGTGKPTNGGIGGYIYETGEIAPGQFALISVVVDSSGEELRRQISRFTKYNESSSLGMAKFDLAKGIAAEESLLAKTNGTASDEMADSLSNLSSGYDVVSNTVPFPSVAETSTADEFNSRKFFYERLLAPSGMPIPVGPGRDKVLAAYSKVMEWDNGGQVMFSSPEDKKELDAAVANLKDVYDGLFFSEDSPEPTINLSGLQTSRDSSSADEMADLADFTSRADPDTTGLAGHKRYNPENIEERLHSALLVQDSVTGRIGRVRGPVYVYDAESDKEVATGEFEVEFYEGRVNDIPAGALGSFEYDDTGRKTEIIGELIPTSKGSDIDERRAYTVEIRDPEDFEDINNSFFAETPDGLVPVHDSMYGVLKDTNQVGAVAGFVGDGQILLAIKRSDGSTQYQTSEVSNFTPLKIRSFDDKPHGEVRGNTFYVDSRAAHSDLQILKTARMARRLRTMGFVDEKLADATNTMLSKGYLTGSGLSQMKAHMGAHETVRRNKARNMRDAGQASVARIPGNPETVATNNILDFLGIDGEVEVIAQTISEVIESSEGGVSVKKPTNTQLLSVERRLNSPADIVSPERAEQIRQILPLLDSRMIGPVIKELDIAELDYRMNNGFPITDLYKMDRDINQLVVRNITSEQVERLKTYQPTKNLDGTPIKETSDEMSDASEQVAVTLSDEQKSVIDQIENGGRSIFVTGKAGTGKSTLLRALINESPKKDSTVVTASTALAAKNVDGVTLASLFHSRAATISTPYWSQDIFKIVKEMKQEKKDVLKAMDRLVIDEISMVNADMMDHVDSMLRLIKGKVDEPFGGVQVVMFGDPYQLRPVVKNDPEDPHTKTFAENYQSPWFFHADVWSEVPLRATELTEVFRQKDQELVDILNAYRDGTITPEQISRLNEIGHIADVSKINPDILWIYGTNKEVDDHNNDRLNSLARNGAKVTSFKAEIKGQYFNEEKNQPTSPNLALAVGARIQFIKNGRTIEGTGEKEYVNGGYGTVMDLGPDYLVILPEGLEDVKKNYVRVLRDTWDRQIVTPKTFTRKDGTIGVGVSNVSSPGDTFKQFPVRLGYAITAHKAQGQTYDSAVIALGSKAFSSGQAYVALSRVRTPEGMYITNPMSMKDVITDYDVRRFMNVVHSGNEASKALSDGGDEMSDTPTLKDEPFDPSDPNLDMDEIRGYDYTKRPDGEPLSDSQAKVLDTMQKRIESGLYADLYKEMRRNLYESWFSRPSKSKENSLRAVEARTQVLSSKGSDRDLVGNKVTKATYTDQFGRQYDVVITTRVERSSDGTLVKLPSVKVYDKTSGKDKSDYVGSFGTEISRDNTENGFAPRGSVYISTAETDEPYRRRGIATAMLSLAREVSGTRIQHSRATTAQGNAFANSIGDDKDLVPGSVPTILDYNADTKDVSSDEMADEPFDPTDPNLDLDKFYGYDFTKTPDGQPLNPMQARLMSGLQKRIEEASLDTGASGWGGNLAKMYKTIRRDMYSAWFTTPTKDSKNTLEEVNKRLEFPEGSDPVDPKTNGEDFRNVYYTDQYGRKYYIEVHTIFDEAGVGRGVSTTTAYEQSQNPDFLNSGWSDRKIAAQLHTDIVDGNEDVEEVGQPIGQAYILNLSTNEEFRRRGLATAMLSVTRTISGEDIHHSTKTTAQGNAFANSIKDDESKVKTSKPTISRNSFDDTTPADEMADEPFDPLDPNLDLDSIYKYDFTKTPSGKPLTDVQTKAMDAATAQIDSTPDSNKKWKDSLKAVRRDLYRSWFVTKDSSPENTIESVSKRLKFNETLTMSHDILRSASNAPVASYAEYTDQYGREYVITVDSVRDGYLSKNRAVANVFDLKNREKRIGGLYSDGDINGGDGPVYVHGVTVDEIYRRRGLATAMLVAARILSNEDIHHSKDTTAFGNAFANSIGDSPDRIKTSKPSVIRDTWLSDDRSDEMSDEPTPSLSALNKEEVTLFSDRNPDSGDIALLKTKELFYEEGAVLSPGSDLFNAAAKVFMTGHPSTMGLPEDSYDFETLARAVVSLSTNMGADVSVVDKINKYNKLFDPDFKDLSLEDAYEIASQQVAEFFKDSELELRINPAGLVGMLNDGKYITQHEMSWEDHESSGTTSLYAPNIRAGMEHIWFGDPIHHPVYGYFKSKIQPMPKMIEAYGHVTLHLTEEAKLRSTASIGDSLVYKNSGVPFVWDKGLDSSSKLDPNVLSKLIEYYIDSKGNENYLSEIPEYVEAQIHGSVTPEDIARVTINLNAPKSREDAARMGQESYSAMITDLKTKLNALGIKYDVID